MNAVDVARELLQPLGIQVVAVANGPLREHIMQYRQSDLDLMTRLLDESGLYLRLDGSRAEILGPAGSGEALPLTAGRNLIDAQVAVSSETAGSAVEARAWHPLTVRSLATRVSHADTGRTSAVDIGATAVGGGNVRYFTGGEAQSEAQLEATARAVLSRHQAQAVTFTGLAEGDQRLRPGTPVALLGLPLDLNGEYVLHAVDHLIDQHRGYLCELSSAPAPPWAGRPGSQATVGLVVAVSDPEGRGRVKVALPAIGDVESGWLQVLSAGAGVGKGMTMLPGVDDTVLVLLPLDDPSQGVVLGGLYGEPGTTDPGVAAGQVRRYSFLSPGGQRVVLDDEAGTLSLDDGRGSRLELSPRRVRLTSATGLELEAAAGVRIKGRTVDFERA